MNLKYCYLNEIHKTYTIPPNLRLMKEEISSIFLHKLPSPFLLQYVDADGDKVSISTEQEFQTLLKNELSNLPSLKIYIVPLEGEKSSLQRDLNSPRSNSNGSFEVVEDDQMKAEGIKELNLSKTEEVQEEGKIVVSLQIPQMNTNPLKSLENIEDSQTEETILPPLKSKETNAGDLIEDLSLSFEDDRNIVSPKVLEKGFQTEAEERFKENRKKSLNAFISRMETRRKATLDIQASSENESNDFKDYLNKIITKKSQIGRLQSSPKITKLLYFSIKNSEDKSSKEESQERWVSFSSEHEEMHTPINIEDIGKNLKQKQENWLDYYQEKSDRHKEVEDKEQPNEEETMQSMKRGRARRRRSVSKGGRSCSGLSSISLKSKSRSRSPRRRKNLKRSTLKRRRICVESSRRSRSRDLFEVEKSLSLLRDEEIEERKGKYRELRQWSDLEKVFQRNFDDSREIKEVDIWSDPPYPQYYFQNNMQNFMEQNKTNKENDMNLMNGRQAQGNLFKDLCESLEKDIPENIQIALDVPEKENVESMNASLLTDSEAKEMASAIGCLHKIKEIKTLKINENLFTTERSNLRTKQSNPTFNKWIFKEQEDKEKEKERKLSGENWFSPGKDSFWKKKDAVQFEGKKSQEGTFCMRCWENPICGPVYSCLICEYVEYCEKCAPQITHIHTLTRIHEAKASKSDKNLFQDEEQNSSCDFKIKLKEKSLSEDIDPLGKSLENSLNLWTYQPVEEQLEKFKFEYKEISSTPLSIKSNQREWCLIYKTVCLKNAGQSQWGRCHLEPVGQISGTMTEVSYVAPGDSVLLTLEIHGFFTPGKYTSEWRVVHQEGDVISEMGHLNLDFEILENRGLSLMDDIDYEMDLRRGSYLEEEKGDWKF